MKSKLWLVVLLALLALVGGYSVRADEAKDASDQGEVIGLSVEGRPIRCQVYGDGPDVIWYIATIHGNEAAGTPLMAEFVDWLKKNPD